MTMSVRPTSNFVASVLGRPSHQDQCSHDRPVTSRWWGLESVCPASEYRPRADALGQAHAHLGILDPRGSAAVLALYPPTDPVPFFKKPVL
jgi:hypothetical protein